MKKNCYWVAEWFGSNACLNNVNLIMYEMNYTVQKVVICRISDYKDSKEKDFLCILVV